MHGIDGRLLSCRIELSQWLLNAISSYEVLSLHQDYFKISRPIDRRLYEIARKHCGNQSMWRIRTETLHVKVGAKTVLRNFRQMLKRLATEDSLPEYHVTLEEGDLVIFTHKQGSVRRYKPVDLTLPPDARQDAKAVAPGWDVDYLEQEWREWIARTGKAPHSPSRQFVSFCKTWASKHRLS